MVQQDGKPQTDSGAEQAAPSQKDQGESESAEPDSGKDSTPAPRFRASIPANQQAVKAGKPGQPMHGIGKAGKQVPVKFANLLKEWLLR